VEVPENAFLYYTGDRWECERGFKRSDKRCIPLP
jgi:hypothetical protein